MSEQTDPRNPALSPLAEFYGYAGIAPFLLAALGTALLPEHAGRSLAQQIAVGYGAVILTFVGAVHWGLAVGGRLPASLPVYTGAIFPAVVGTVAILLGGQRALALLAVGFGLFWLYEHRRLGLELPADYLRLRRNLTVAVCALLALTMIVSESVGLR